ncbi:MAG: hypothetical protein VW238_02935 [Nitrosomonadales bacterium]
MNIYDLNSCYALLSITGTDAPTFINGQITNDIKKIEKNKAMYAGICNAKGRIIAFLIICRMADDEFIILIPNDLAEKLKNKLTMYVLRSKVVIEIKNEYEITGVYNPQDLKNLEFITSFQMPLDNRVLVIHKKNTNKPFKRNKNLNDWFLQDIKNGIPFINSNNSENFIAHTINLDILNAINFKKGCYTGQEIVARTQYLGKPKYRTFYGEINRPISSETRELVNNKNEKIGTIIQSALEKDKTLLLFETNIEAIEKDIILEENIIMNVKSFN